MRFYVFLINKKPGKQQIAVQKQESPQSSAKFIAGRHPPKEGEHLNASLWECRFMEGEHKAEAML